MVNKLLGEESGSKEELAFFIESFRGAHVGYSFYDEITKSIKTLEDAFTQDAEHVFISNNSTDRSGIEDLWLFSKNFVMTETKFLDKEKKKAEYHIYGLSQLKAHMMIEAENYRLDDPKYYKTDSTLVLTSQVEEKTRITMKATGPNCCVLLKIIRVLLSP